MAQKVVPMIHVPDVGATVEWYRALGFTVTGTNVEEGTITWASLAFRESALMFNVGGQPSVQDRREVDLYVYADGIDAFYERLQGRVEVVEGPHDTFYGMREFIIRDVNRFWMTFAEVALGRSVSPTEWAP